MVRNDLELLFEDPGVDIREKYGEQFQTLVKINKRRNKFFISGIEPADKSLDVDD